MVVAHGPESFEQPTYCEVKGYNWRSKQTDASMRVSAKVYPHSIGKWRIDEVVRNSDGFGEALGCTKGQPMLPADARRVW